MAPKHHTTFPILETLVAWEEAGAETHREGVMVTNRRTYVEQAYCRVRMPE